MGNIQNWIDSVEKWEIAKILFPTKEECIENVLALSEWFSELELGRNCGFCREFTRLFGSRCPLKIDSFNCGCASKIYNNLTKSRYMCLVAMNKLLRKIKASRKYFEKD